MFSQGHMVRQCDLLPLPLVRKSTCSCSIWESEFLTLISVTRITNNMSFRKIPRASYMGDLGEREMIEGVREYFIPQM